MRTPDPRVPITLACLAAATLLTAPAAAAATPVPPQILAGPGLATGAVDISPLGVVAGMSGPAEPFPGDPAQEARPFRWTPRLDGTYRRQALPRAGGRCRCRRRRRDDRRCRRRLRRRRRDRHRHAMAGARRRAAARRGRTQQGRGRRPGAAARRGPAAQQRVRRRPRARARRRHPADVDAVVPDAQFVRGFFGASVGGPDAVSFGVFGGAGQGSFVEPWVWVDGAGHAACRCGRRSSSARPA